MPIPKEPVKTMQAAISSLEKARKESGLPPRGVFMDCFGHGAREEYGVRKAHPKLYAELKSTNSSLIAVIRQEFGSSGKWGPFETSACRFKTDLAMLGSGIYGFRMPRIWAYDRHSQYSSLVAIVEIVPPALAGGADLLIRDCTRPAEDEDPKGQYPIRLFKEVVEGLKQQLSKFQVEIGLPGKYVEKAKEKNRKILDVQTLVKSNLELLKGGD